jgi:hypothetical protein
MPGGPVTVIHLEVGGPPAGGPARDSESLLVYVVPVPLRPVPLADSGCQSESADSESESLR